MKNMIRLFTIATLVVAAAMTFAQGGGMRMGGFGGGNMSMLLMREDVKTEIKLTAEQSTKLEDMRTAMMQDMQAKFQGGGAGDQDEIRKVVTEMMKKAEKDALTVLDDSQKKRLKELWIQRSGNRVVTNEDIQKELGMTDDQKSQIKKLMTAQEEANAEIRQKMMNGEMDRSEIRPLMEKNNKALDAELGKVITKDQADKLKAMGGAPFKFVDEG